MPDITEGSDAAGSASTAYRLTVGETAQGRISSSTDVDWYRVSLTAGQTYTFALVGTGGNALSDGYIRLLNSSGVGQAGNDDFGPGFNATFTFTATSSGTYYIEAVGVSSQTGQYGLSFTAGGLAHYDYMMGAGNLIRHDYSGGYYRSSWSSSPGTATTVTYSFDTSNSDQTDASGVATAFIALSSAQRSAAQLSLQMFADVGNVKFSQVSANTGTMRFSAYNSTTDGAGAYAYFPGGRGAESLAGDVNLNNDSVSTSSLPRGSYSFFAMLHEIGHAMGLQHPGDYNAAPGVSIEYGTHAQFREDSHQYSVMSYFDESNTTNSVDSYPDTLLMFDILAIQQLYGVNRNTRAGDSVYGFNANTGSVYNFASNTTPFFCIWDGKGTDTIDASLYSMAQKINLQAGTFSDIGGYKGNVSIAIGAVIENAKGGKGNDSIIGNSAANRLVGNAGNDTIKASSGNDKLYGGSGNDKLYGGTGKDTLSGGSGKDTFYFNTALSSSTNVDTITDFSVADDTIALENAIFTKLTKTGTLASSAFVANKSGLATDSKDRIIYETDTGNLYYDSNGNASGGRVLFAKLDDGLKLTHNDFLVV